MIEKLKKMVSHIPEEHGAKDEQLRALYDLAKKSNEPIVEIGSYMGRSTVVLALGSKAGNKMPIYAIEPFILAGQPEKNLEKLKENLKVAGVDDIVTIIPKTSQQAKPPKKIGFLFIDGNHEYEWVKYDFLKYEPYVVLGGWIAMHDFHFKGIKRVFDEIVYPALWKGTNNKENKLSNFKLIKEMMVFQKKATPWRK